MLVHYNCKPCLRNESEPSRFLEVKVPTLKFYRCQTLRKIFITRSIVPLMAECIAQFVFVYEHLQIQRTITRTIKMSFPRNIFVNRLPLNL